GKRYSIGRSGTTAHPTAGSFGSAPGGRAAPPGAAGQRMKSAQIRRPRSGCPARAASAHETATPPSSDMNSRRFMGGGPHVGGRTIPRRYLKKLRCIAAKLNIEWQRWVIASDGDAPNAHRRRKGGLPR